MVPMGALPGKFRKVEAMLPLGAALRVLAVSYQPVDCVVELLGDDSKAKNANRRFFRIGPPRLAPY